MRPDKNDPYMTPQDNRFEGKNYGAESDKQSEKPSIDEQKRSHFDFRGKVGSH